MTLFHRRWGRRVSLLAAGALAASEEAVTRAHLATCLRCREDERALEDLLGVIAADPLRTAVPTLSVGALLARVEARLDAGERPSSHAPSTLLREVAAAAAVGLTLVALLRAPAPGPRPVEQPGTVLPDDMMRRIEGTMAREHAARYLAEAQDVLVTVAARQRGCEKAAGRVDVDQEARRSRALLQRRALLFEMDRDEVASARPVLEDVERILREVASLESCARAGDLEAIHRQMEERRLLMKIDLMSRELLG